MKLLSIVLATTLFALSVKATPEDVVPKNFKRGSTYVRVTKISDLEVKFEKCIAGNEANTCKTIGPRDSYLIEDLEGQRIVENLQVSGSVVADIAIVLAAIYTGGAVGSLFLTADLGSMGFIVVGGAVGAGAGISVPFFVKTLNPVEQYRQAKTLEKAIIKDELVVANDINKFIKRLELVLNKI